MSRKRTYYIARDKVSGKCFLARDDGILHTSERIAGSKPTGSGTVKLQRFRSRSDEAAIIRFVGRKATGHFAPGNVPALQPQEHYKRIGSVGGKMNRGRRYSAKTGFVLLRGRWRNPDKIYLSELL